MNIVFINQPITDDKLGIYILSRVLKEAGHTVKIVLINDVDDSMIKALNDIDFVLYSVNTLEYKWFKKINDCIKGKLKSKTVVGGPHFTFFPDDGINDPNIDYVVQGPGEDVLLDIINGNSKTKFIKGSLPDLSKYGGTDRSIYYNCTPLKQSPVHRYMSSRGCPNKCSYCHNTNYIKLYGGEWITQRIPAEVFLKEILDSLDEFGPHHVFICDDNFVADKSFIDAFCKNYHNMKADFQFTCLARADNLTLQDLEKLQDSNLKLLCLSLEASNPITLKLLNRRGNTVEDIEKVVKWCKLLSIRVRVQNMIGLPVDDPLGDALETLVANYKIAPTLSSVSTYQPFVGTALWQYCIDHNFIKHDDSINGFGDKSILKIPSVDEIFNLGKWWAMFVKNEVPIDIVKSIIKIPLPIDLAIAMGSLNQKIYFREFIKDL